MADQLAAVLRAVFGIAVFLGICWALSLNRSRINWRLVAGGLGLQLALAVLILKAPFAREAVDAVARFFVALLAFSSEGAAFLFGSLVTDQQSFGFIFAFNVLPSIVFFSAFTSALYYLGILQRMVYGCAWVMKRTMQLSGSESLAAAANIFIGQTEAPLIIRPYLATLTRSEVMSLMTGGMATIAGAVLVAYIGLLGGTDPAQQLLFAKHLLTASLLSAPAALVVAKIMLPETEPVSRDLLVPRERIGSNLLDAATIGTTDGIKLAVNVGGVLLAFTALIAMVNYGLTHWIGSWTGINAAVASASGGLYEGLTLPLILGVVFLPAAWLVGIPWGDALAIGQVLGERTALNEFYAYVSLARLRESGAIADPRSLIIATYALCGFANLTSMGIQVGGISVLAPGQRANLASLAFRAMIGGTIACFITACIASMLI
jgi:concentrative nucleoside transporter, CNT family